MSDNKIYKPKPISGFPEWLPEYRVIEQQWMDKIRAVFERYGFCSIETPSVEEIEALEAKGGETEKEIYTLGRIHDDGNPQLISDMYKYHLKQGKSKEEAFSAIKTDLTNFFSHNMDPEAAQNKASDQIMALIAAKESRLALHFDLTVPMARYVAQHFNGLVFPFKRYQMQRVWRGERPQKGRSREFYQCDIDVVNVDSLPLHFDAELPAVMFEAYQALDIPPVELHINNRKILIGFLNGIFEGKLDANEIRQITILLDKMDKARDYVEAELRKDHDAEAQKMLDFVAIKAGDSSFIDKVRALGVTNELLEQGLNELKFVMDNLQHLPKDSVVANLGIIRGLDYYTGTVVEVRFKGKPMAIGGGGRYDDLAGSFINQKLPGIGMSIGLTRLFGMLLEEGYIKPGAKSPTHILVVLPEESRRAEAAATAQKLRQQGYNVELFHSDSKVKRQLSYAERKGIPFVWFPPFEDGKPHEVKNMATGTQTQVDLSNLGSLKEVLQ